MSEPSKEPIRVSDHATLRYLERAMGLNIDIVREHIASICAGPAAFGANCVRAEGLRFEIACMAIRNRVAIPSSTAFRRTGHTPPIVATYGTTTTARRRNIDTGGSHDHRHVAHPRSPRGARIAHTRSRSARLSRPRSETRSSRATYRQWQGERSTCPQTTYRLHVLRY